VAGKLDAKLKKENLNTSLFCFDCQHLTQDKVITQLTQLHKPLNTSQVFLSLQIIYFHISYFLIVRMYAISIQNLKEFLLTSFSTGKMPNAFQLPRQNQSLGLVLPIAYQFAMSTQ